MQKVSFGYHARRNPQGKSKLEKGFLLYRLESASTHRIDRYRLQQKMISATKAIMPSGNIDKDMREIKLYFKDFQGKHPENFALGEI